jgi:hypothetical protein
LLAGAARVDRRRTQGFPQPCAPGQQTIASREGYEAANICASSPEMQQNWEARPSPTRSLESEDSDPDPLLHMDVRMARNAWMRASGCCTWMCEWRGTHVLHRDVRMPRAQGCAGAADACERLSPIRFFKYRRALLVREDRQCDLRLSLRLRCACSSPPRR